MGSHRFSTVSLVAPECHSLLLPGRYFLTVITTPRRKVLSDILPDGRLRLLEAGLLLKNEFIRCERLFPTIRIDACKIMPDHFHLCFRVTDRLPHKITEIATNWLRFSARNAKQRGIDLPWNYRYRLFVSVTEERYRRCLDYTDFNDDCAALAQDPGTFCTVHTVRHPALNPTFAWDCFGDDTLLDRPDIVALHVPHDATPDDLLAIRQNILLAARADMTIAGGFISAAERDIIREVRERYPQTRFIHFRPESLKYYKPTSAQYLHFAAHRWLEISSVPRSSEDKISRAVCVRHNLAAEALEAGCTAVCFGEEPHKAPAHP